MSSLNFIGGEKGGVGKSVTARLLAQYFIDKNQPFTAFDTDRSHNSFARFYADYASPVVVDGYEGLDQIVGNFDEASQSNTATSVIVDLAAQTAAPLSRWIMDADLLTLLSDMGVTTNFWHVTDSSKDSVDLLTRLINTYGARPNYIVVRNQGRGSDFSYLDKSESMQKALSTGAHVIDLPQLHEASMNKIDRFNTSFWAAVNDRSSADALGMLERQRVKVWLRNVYETFDALPL
ncbi:hypothetical protein [Arenimonas sp.]|uniref:hypothetical protein n=1 Tax=Arenimonas sp. TaxID=1872635 RepID=UPI0039E4071B